MVDMEMLKGYAVGLGTFAIAVAFVVIITTNMEGLHLGTVACTTDGCSDNTTTNADLLLSNGTSLIGSMVTTWGSIILLGVVVIAIFVGIFVALSYMSGRGGR